MGFLHSAAARRSRLQRAVSILMGALSFGALASQIIFLPKQALTTTIGFAALALIVSVLAYRRYDHYRQIAKDLQRATGSRAYASVASSGTLRTGYAKDEAQVRMVALAELELYGNEAVGAQLLYEWYRANRHGIIVLTEEHNRIIGTLGFWPLKPAAFSKLRSGAFYDLQLRGLDIVPVGREHACLTWYLSSLTISGKHCRKGAVVLLLVDLLKRVLEVVSANEGRELKIVALAFSDNGLRLLERFGFNVLREGDETSHGYPVCLLTVQTRREVEDIIARLGYHKPQRTSHHGM